MKTLIANEVALIAGGSDWSEGSSGGDRPPESIFANDLNCFAALIIDGLFRTDYQETFCKK